MTTDCAPSLLSRIEARVAQVRGLPPKATIVGFTCVPEARGMPVWLLRSTFYVDVVLRFSDGRREAILRPAFRWFECPSDVVAVEFQKSGWQGWTWLGRQGERVDEAMEGEVVAYRAPRSGLESPAAAVRSAGQWRLL